MIKRLTNSKLLSGRPTESITAAAFIIAVSGFASRFLGLLRDRILASQFGAGDTLDAYYAAFRIPDLLYNLLILGALSAAFIPVFTGLISKNKEEEGWELTSGILNLNVAVLIFFAAIFAIFAPSLMHLITPGFSGAKMDLTITLTRIMFLSPIFLGISAVFGGVLVSMKKFVIYSIAPIMYNIGIIIGALFFVRFMGPSGLALGVILGAFMHMLIQYPAVKFSGFKFNLSFAKALKNKHVREVIRLMIPRTIGIAINQINFLIITVFASLLASGSLAIFNFANNIQSFPLALFGVSFAMAVFPTLSACAAKDDKKEFAANFSRTFRKILFFVIPLTFFMIMLRAQLVRVILGSGQFNWEDTVLTFETLGVLMLCLFSQSLEQLLTRAFFAIHDTKIPFYAAIGTEILNILLVVLLIGRFSVIGLAIAYSAASIFDMIVLFVILSKRMGGLDGRNIFNSTMKVLLASAISGLVIQVSKNFIGRMANIDTFLGIFTQMIISGGLGIVVFLAMSYILKIEEFFHFKNSIFKRFSRDSVTINEISDETEGM